MPENHLRVSQGFRHMLTTLAPYVARELQIEFGKNWWQTGVLSVLYEDQKRELPNFGNWEQLVDSLDVQRCLLLFDLHWNQVFRKRLSVDHRNWAKELGITRNKLAHIGGKDFNDDDTWRALDTMSRLCEQIDPQTAEDIRSILREARYGSAQGSTAADGVMVSGSEAPKTKSAGVLQVKPVKNLPSWRDVIEPHPDVAQGRYKNAEFAADLAQVARGEGTFEYRDPVEFFGRTYVTDGMAGLLTQALKRVCGKDGEPVIQLKTAFGGGKTHSMLALYHLLRGQISIEKVPAAVPLLQQAGISSLPRVNVAVLVGTELNPSKSRRPQNFPGITINTLWGELAAQLAESAGRPQLYEYVKEADRKGVSPGSSALKDLFDACGPCLILIDELVAYAKKLYGVDGLPAGSFDNLISFIQEITEAARASKNSLVVASIPESDIEIGGEAGKLALETIEHTFGRMEAIWKPVAANEGFEIVRRRLFLNCKDPAARELVCDAFSQMYQNNVTDFPIESKELEYKQRLISCYPIHPEVFDRLYEDWATLERFQKTRGVLRLMASVVHDLWMSNDAGLMIMPGSFSMDNPNVRDELTRHLPENWNSLVDSQVDGKSSLPYQKDQGNPRYGHALACRRMARTILLGSAPSVKEQTVRGIEAARIRLGVVQPGENIAIFNDALGTLQNSLAYLYANPSGDRFWFDTRPTLRKTVDDRMTQISLIDIDYEVEQRLRKTKKEYPFTGVHICPGSSLDVPDEQSVRLVILKPDDTYKASVQTNSALSVAEEILNNRGPSPRLYRNMLVFIAPDMDFIQPLNTEIRRYLAWHSIKNDSELLNLDASQNREVDASLARSAETVDIRIREAYCWLLVPSIDIQIDLKTIEWEIGRISGGNNSLVTKTAIKMQQEETLITRWSPMLLLRILDSVLWKDKDYIEIKTLWTYLTTYCYLPRLASFSALEEVIVNGLGSPDYFALAEGISNGRYVALKFNEQIIGFNPSDILVKVSVAKEQREREKQVVIPNGDGQMPGLGDQSGNGMGSESGTGFGNSGDFGGGVGAQPPIQPQNKHFFMSATLDNTRIVRDVSRLVDEIVNHLSSVDGSTVEITLEVQAQSGEGFSVPTVRAVTENARTLKVDTYRFEE